jgi:GAF domain-containing protein
LLEFVESEYAMGRPGDARVALDRREPEIRELERLAAQQAALRRVATMVARECSPKEVFAKVAEELSVLLQPLTVRMVRFEPDGTATLLAAGGTAEERLPVGTNAPIPSGGVIELILRTGEPAKVEDYSQVKGPIGDLLRQEGARWAVGGPIVVGARIWGAMVVGSSVRESSPEVEEQVTQFAQLVSAAISNVESRAKMERLAAEQSALRRVATLVAQDVASEELFGAVAAEVGTLFGADFTGMIRYEADPSFVTTVATWAAVGEHPPAPSRSRIVPGDPTSMVADTGRPARVDDWVNVPGPIAEFVRRELGVTSSVGSPIVVNGSLWGALAVHSKHGPLPSDTESRLLSFTELVATAIANTSARAEVSRLAEEQAALRRVATLVAQGGQPSDVLDTVAAELADQLRADHVVVCRYEAGSELTVLAHRGTASQEVPPGTRINHEGDSVEAVVWRSERSARRESYEGARGTIAELARAAGVQVAVGAPVVVEGRLWGVASAGWNWGQPPPADTEQRMARFAELLGTAIANTDSREALRRLAGEQAALRRVATLVAEGSPPTAVFDAVAAEMAALLDADGITVVRYEPGDELTVMAHRGPGAPQVPPGTRVRHDGASVSATVRRTQRPARMASYTNTHGHIGEVIGSLRFRSGVGAPIVVDGRVWGATIANWTAEEPPQPGTEQRLAKFARLLDTAIANADSRDQLTASRARLVTEAHEARRRVVRDLHDGAQQGLVRTIITLKLARRAVDDGQQDLAPLVSEALEYAETTNGALRELVHGILPSVLTRGGLRAGVDELAERTSIPVEIDVGAERFAPVVEATAYFVVAEALTNVVKHAHAERAQVRAFVKDEALHVEVCDNGVGGANARGHGLVGLSDRVTALEGRLNVESPAEGGTIVAATLPLDSK